MRKRIPALSDSFVPPIPQGGDEYFRNGIFCFNITRIRHDIEAGRCECERSHTDISIWNQYSGGKKLEDKFVEAADLTRPVIIAEISPDKMAYSPEIDPGDWKLRGYNLLDGNHRVEKAARCGIKALDAYILPMESHIRYMYEGYRQFVEYWSDKQRELSRHYKNMR